MSKALAKVGDQIASWEIVERIGEGTFSEVYSAHHVSNRAKAALKLDRPSARATAQWEANLLKQMQKYPFVPRLYGVYEHNVGGREKEKAGSAGGAGGAGGAVSGAGVVLAMQLLGANLSTLRKRQPGNQFPYATCVHIVQQMLCCVEALHAEGYCHRDLKPSNVVQGLSRAGRRQLFLLDFGQSRQYTMPGTAAPGYPAGTGTVRPARENADFRGTSLYASPHAHDGKDLAPRDDLWSLLFIFVDMARGALPWRAWKDERAKCGALKRYYAGGHIEELVAGLPGAPHLLAAFSHVAGLKFEERPDYALLAKCFQKVLADARAAGAAGSRPRPAYAVNDELRAILATFSSGGGGGGAGKAAAPTPTAAAVAAVAHAGAAAAAEEAGSGSSSSSSSAGGAAQLLSPPPLPCGSAFAALTDGDADLLSVFDTWSQPCSVDGVLYSRGGSWAPHTYGGTTVLDGLLAVGSNGEPTPEALELSGGLAKELAACEDMIRGYEGEADADDSASDSGSEAEGEGDEGKGEGEGAGAGGGGAAAAAAVGHHGSHLDHWLSKHPGPDISRLMLLLEEHRASSNSISGSSSISGGVTAEGQAAVLRGLNSALMCLPRVLLHAARPGASAQVVAAAYLKAWAQVTECAVTAFRPYTRSTAAGVPQTVLDALQALHAARTAASGASGVAEVEAAIAAAAAEGSAAASAAAAAATATAGEALALLRAGDPSHAPLVVLHSALGDDAARVHRAAAGLQAWLHDCSGRGVASRAAAAAATAVSLALGLSLSSLSGGGGGAGGGISSGAGLSSLSSLSSAAAASTGEDSEAELRREARRAVRVLGRLLAALRRERECMRPATAPAAWVPGAAKRAAAATASAASAVALLGAAVAAAPGLADYDGSKLTGKKRSRWGESDASASASSAAAAAAAAAAVAAAAPLPPPQPAAPLPPLPAAVPGAPGTPPLPPGTPPLLPPHTPPLAARTPPLPPAGGDDMQLD